MKNDIEIFLIDYLFYRYPILKNIYNKYSFKIGVYKMRKRYFTIFICMLLLSTIICISIANATETKNNSGINSTMMFCNVDIKGTATVRLVKDSFFLGFGKCLYMKIDLENDSSIEISSIINPTNSIELQGGYQIHLIGFSGRYHHIFKTRIDGEALIAIWALT